MIFAVIVFVLLAVLATLAISSIYNTLIGAEANTNLATNRLVSVTGASLTVTQALHEGKILALNRSGGSDLTLPAATGTGSIYRFVVGTVSTTGYTIATAPTTDIFQGNIWTSSAGETPDLGQPWITASNSNKITLNGTTTGGVSKGDRIELIDIASGVWAVIGFTSSSGTEATPFSHV